MSRVEFQIGSNHFQIETGKAYDISIPYQFDNQGVTAFGVDYPESTSVSGPVFCGDTQRGGSCNVTQLRFIPHCHGTHTECVGHVVNQPVSVSDIVQDVWIPATLISVKPVAAVECSDRYASAIERDDWIITRDSLCNAITPFDDARFYRALIVRTLPNPPMKRNHAYDTAPFFSNDALDEICKTDILHLLVDLPSVDRMQDQGKLSNHRRFWELPTEGHDLGKIPASSKTITELIYVHNRIADGYYFLNLQIAPFVADAAPSRPLLYPVSQR